METLRNRKPLNSPKTRGILPKLNETEGIKKMGREAVLDYK